MGSEYLRVSQKSEVQFGGVPIIRTIAIGGLYWDSPILGNYNFRPHPHVEKLPWP